MSVLKIKSVKISLDKERHLIFDLNAFEELEEIYGSTSAAFDAFAKDQKKIKHIKNFLFAGLVHEDASLTPALIGTMLSYGNLAEITEQITKAVSQGTPDAKEGSEAEAGE